MKDNRQTERWQAEAIAAGDLLIWTICENPSDHPGLFTVRPHSSRTNKPCDLILIAFTLAAARKLLPPGLILIQRDPSDPPVIVESWV